jgi:hypothetical protein
VINGLSQTRFVFAWLAGCPLQLSGIEASTEIVLTKLEHVNATIMAFTTSMQATYDSLTTASNDMVSMLQCGAASSAIDCTNTLQHALVLSCHCHLNAMHVMQYMPCNFWMRTASRGHTILAARTMLCSTIEHQRYK